MKSEKDIFLLIQLEPIINTAKICRAASISKSTGIIKFIKKKTIGANKRTTAAGLKGNCHVHMHINAHKKKLKFALSSV